MPILNQHNGQSEYGRGNDWQFSLIVVYYLSNCGGTNRNKVAVKL